MTTTETVQPTGLDYQAAYAAMYPGLVQSGLRLQDASDSVLKVVDRAARLRRSERERVKAEFLALAERLDDEQSTTSIPYAAIAKIRKTVEEIR